MSWPAAEVDVAERLVRDLLEQQHPDLAGLALHEVGFGFDNSLWRLGSELLVRLPRRLMAAELVENEQRWVPLLAPDLPIKVPVPIRFGWPSGVYPWRWSIVAWLDGQPADVVGVRDEITAGRQLGAFMRALHREAPDDAPFNPWRSVPLADRNDTFEQRLARLKEYVDEASLRRVWQEALKAPPIRKPRLGSTVTSIRATSSWRRVPSPRSSTSAICAPATPLQTSPAGG